MKTKPRKHIVMKETSAYLKLNLGKSGSRDPDFSGYVIHNGSLLCLHMKVLMLYIGGRA